jgi:hypothetical protein
MSKVKIKYHSRLRYKLSACQATFDPFGGVFSQALRLPPHLLTQTLLYENFIQISIMTKRNVINITKRKIPGFSLRRLRAFSSSISCLSKNLSRVSFFSPEKRLRRANGNNKHTKEIESVFHFASHHRVSLLFFPPSSG